ncbi:MAG: hypothetical protein ACR2KP_20700, partial [Egibacteraceae bacterium]
MPEVAVARHAAAAPEVPPRGGRARRGGRRPPDYLVFPRVLVGLAMVLPLGYLVARAAGAREQ